MQTGTRRAMLVHHAVTLLFGALLATAIWLAGYAEISWLGFAAAALYGEAPAGCLARSHRARPSRP